MDRPLRVGQLNAQGSAVATREIPALAAELRLDVVLVQEPYSAQQHDSTISFIWMGPGAKAALYVPRLDVQCSLLSHVSNSHCAVCHVAWGRSSLYLVSAYFQYSHDIQRHLKQMDKVFNALQGRAVLVGADTNAHSPLWHSFTRNYVGRGPDVAARRRAMEDFLLARDLVVQNTPGQPSTFYTANGESNIDVTFTTRGVRVTDWGVREDISSSDHRLLTFQVRGTGDVEPAPAAESSGVPRRFRDRGVDWDRFQAMIHERVGGIKWARPASDVCKQFTRMIVQSAEECMGTRGEGKKMRGYEWWSPKLETLRKSQNKARKDWQRARRVKSSLEDELRKVFHDRRSKYRVTMEGAQLEFFRKLAESGNEDPWGLAYRAASGRFRPPPNVINGILTARGHTTDVRGAMQGLIGALCPDDDITKDTNYHRSVRMAAACIPSGKDAPPPSRQDLAGIVKDLPNTAPGIDGITARMVRHVWHAAGPELTRMFGKCVEEGTFPETWKDGRLVVLPKGNDRDLADPKAYRPVTLLPVLGKILERVMLRCAPSLSRAISTSQHGFSRGRSTLTALHEILDTVSRTSARYVQAVFLDISGAFDNAWWPMILLKAKSAGCPPNVFRMLAAYFCNRRVGLFVGGGVVWKTATMGCPQGSVLGPSLWNLLMDDLLRLPFPDGVTLVAYADDVTVLIESNSRAGIEASASCALGLISGWGVRNRLDFSPLKSFSVTLKGGLAARPPTIRLNGVSVRSVRSTRVLGVVIDGSLSFAEHARSIGERAASGLGKMSRVSASSWGMRYRALKVLYQGIFTPILTYAAGCWWRRVSTYVVRTALLRAQRPALILLTKAYRSTSTAALPVLAGVLPADLEVERAGKVDDIRHLPGRELKVRKNDLWEEAVASWQQRWEAEARGRELYRYFPDVAARLKATWVEPDYQVSQILTGHGCFRKRLHDMKLQETSECYCGEDEESLDHVLWSCPIYEEQRRKMMDGIEREEEGPVYYCDLVASEVNFRRLGRFAHEWHKIRSRLELEDGSRAGGEAVICNRPVQVTATPERGECWGH